LVVSLVERNVVSKEDIVPYRALIIAGAIGLSVLSLPRSLYVLGATGQAAGAQKPVIAIPQSLRTEHEEIHQALAAATRASGRVGAAAKELAAVLHHHFERENEIALPPLGLLAPLAAGDSPAGMQEVLTMTDALRKEMPRMLEEHERIRAATEKLRIAAREENAPVQEQLAETLAAHARTEEEILYPAAILVGNVIRARIAKK
jgi:hypothetical protein